MPCLKRTRIFKSKHYISVPYQEYKNDKVRGPHHDSWGASNKQNVSSIALSFIKKAFVLRQIACVAGICLLLSQGKVGDVEDDVNEDNHDEYKKGRGENEEENPNNIETAGFSLERKLKCPKMPFSLLLLFHKGYLHLLMEEEAQHFGRCISYNLEI